MARILNPEMLTTHGNVRGRKAMLEILEAGLQAADPYYNTCKAMRLDGSILTIGGPDFMMADDPVEHDEVLDLSKFGRIFVFGAGKGSQRAAKAIEDTLGDWLTGGHIIDKHGGDLICERIGVTFGAHPVPDEGCVRGCQRILEIAQDLREDDLVFTVVCNGVSSLLTLPAPGISLEDVRETTYLMQIDRGAPTADLNPIRNHIDQMKGGRFSRHLQPAKVIHFVVWNLPSYAYIYEQNVWLHSLSEVSTFATAVHNLKKWDAWDDVPASVREHLLRADPAQETVKFDEFEKMDARVFALMPTHLLTVPVAVEKARALGFTPYVMYETVTMKAEASQVGVVMANIATQVERTNQPFQAPAALIGRTEMIVTVGKGQGMGGRNQEYALAAAVHIEGSERIVMGSVDTDGTDGPGKQFNNNYPDIPVLDGAIVDGTTARRVREELGRDLFEALKDHNTSPVLYPLGDGVVATPNISMNDLTVTLILDKA